MDGEGGNTRVLQPFGKLQIVQVAPVPAQANFGGDRPASRPANDGGGHFGGFLRVPGQARALPVVAHLGHRAAHVDVDDVRPGVLGGFGGGLFHGLLIAAEKLDGGGVLPLAQLQQGEGLSVLIAEGLGGDHLSDGVARPQLPADSAEGKVGDPRHGGQHQGGRDIHTADFHTYFPRFCKKVLLLYHEIKTFAIGHFRCSAGRKAVPVALLSSGFCV